MVLGEVVEYGGHRWRVYKMDKGARTVALIRWGGTTEEVADDDAGLSVVVNPCEWPIVTARLKPNSGALARV